MSVFRVTVFIPTAALGSVLEYLQSAQGIEVMECKLLTLKRAVTKPKPPKVAKKHRTTVKRGEVTAFIREWVSKVPPDTHFGVAKLIEAAAARGIVAGSISSGVRKLVTLGELRSLGNGLYERPHDNHQPRDQEV